MQECLLCKRNYKLSKEEIFGKNCLKKLYKLANISIPKNAKNKEKYLINKIAKENKKSELKDYQKQLLAERYLTLQYLERITYGDFKKIKKEIREEIDFIDKCETEKDLKTIKKITLNDAYKLYNKSEKFKLNLKKLNKLNSNRTINQAEAMKFAISGFNFIFKHNIKINPYENTMLKAMQLVLLETVVVGGIGFKYNLAAMLLQHSLQKKPKDITIENENIIEDILNDENFKSTIKNMVDKYGENTDNFKITKNEQDKFMFDNSDLYFAIHGVYVNMDATKNKSNKWNLDILLQDTYDYTEFKILNDYYSDANSVLKSVVSSILYNIAYFAQKSGTLTPYEVYIKIKIEDYSKEE